MPIIRAKGLYGMLENGGKFTAIYHSGVRECFSWEGVSVLMPTNKTMAISSY